MSFQSSLPHDSLPSRFIERVANLIVFSLLRQTNGMRLTINQFVCSFHMPGTWKPWNFQNAIVCMFVEIGILYYVLPLPYTFEIRCWNLPSKKVDWKQNWSDDWDWFASFVQCELDLNWHSEVKLSSAVVVRVLNVRCLEPRPIIRYLLIGMKLRHKMLKYARRCFAIVDSTTHGASH